MHLSDDAVMSRKISTEVIKSLEQMLGEFISHLETRGDLGRVSPLQVACGTVFGNFLLAFKIYMFVRLIH